MIAIGAFVGCDGAQPKPPAQGKTHAADARVAPAADAPPAHANEGAGGASSASAPTWTLSTESSDPARIEVGGLSFPKPTTWLWQRPTMQFRTLQYVVPGPGGEDGGAAELVVSLFPGGDGGPIDANIDRWTRQFRGADGSPATPVREELTVAGIKVSLIELKGAYQGMGAAAPRPGQMQLGAIVQAPGRNLFFRINGPERTVEQQRGPFRALVDGLRVDLPSSGE